MDDGVGVGDHREGSPVVSGRGWRTKRVRYRSVGTRVTLHLCKGSFTPEKIRVDGITSDRGYKDNLFDPDRQETDLSRNMGC